MQQENFGCEYNPYRPSKITTKLQDTFYCEKLPQQHQQGSNGGKRDRIGARLHRVGAGRWRHHRSAGHGAVDGDIGAPTRCHGRVLQNHCGVEHATRDAIVGGGVMLICGMPAIVVKAGPKAASHACWVAYRLGHAARTRRQAGVSGVGGHAPPPSREP